MKTLNNESDLGDAYAEWLGYKSLGEGRDCTRFGQYIYNKYNIEYGNSYNTRSDLDAYNLLSEYLYQKGEGNESK